MEAEFLQLAQEAGVSVARVWAGAFLVVIVVLHIIGHTVIGWQLWQMQKSWWQREREVDAMAARLRETNREVEEALDRQCQALERQGEAMRRSHSKARRLNGKAKS